MFQFSLDNLKRLTERQELKRIASNASWLFFDKVLRLGVGLFIGIWIARYLGPSDFGVYNYAIAMTSILAVVATLGLDSIVVKELLTNPANAKNIIGSTFVLRLLAGFLSFILCVGIIYALNTEGSSVTIEVALIVSLTLFSQSFDTIDLYFQSQVKSKYTVIAKNTSFILFSVVKIILLYTKSDLVAFAWAYTGEAMVGAVFLIVALNQKFPGIRLLQFHAQKGVQLLKISWSMILSGLVIMIYMRIDQLMLKEFLGNEAVGVYSVAVRISEVWYFIPSVIMTSVFPAIIKSKEQGETIYLTRLQKLYTFMTWISTPVALVVSFISNYLILFLFGESYAEAGIILAIHIWTGIFVFQGSARGYWLVTEGLQVYGMYYTSAACLLNVILNYWFIPLHGPYGAAIATLISQFCSVIVFPLLFKKTRNSSIQLLKSFIWKLN
ncbi:MAG TPA: flippase [Ohtaekwangia sp.]